jgi:hypothetical protein
MCATGAVSAMAFWALRGHDLRYAVYVTGSEPPYFSHGELYSTLARVAITTFYGIFCGNAVALPAVVVVFCLGRFQLGHCASCGYNLRGNVSGRCPECGTPKW